MTDDSKLEAFFGAARKTPVEVPEALMARVLQDAATLRPAPVAPPQPRPDRGGWFRQLGGWPALGGMLAASVAGLWLGVAQPSGVSGLTSSVLGSEVSVSLFSYDTILAAEG